MKKGKQEQYLKDDADLNSYLLQSALNNAGLHISETTPPISGSSLESLAQQFTSTMSTVKRLSRRYDELLIEKLIYMPELTSDIRVDNNKYDSWLLELTGRLNAEQSSSTQYHLARLEADELQSESIKIVHKVHGISAEHLLPIDFFSSGEYQKLVKLGAQLDGLLSEGAYVQRGERRQQISSFKQALGWLMEEAKRGRHIQRYKGLGEMNAEQLWETTMNMESRRLLRVSIEDAVGSDEIFTILMGDQVEPRREFIEQNALSVET